MKVHPYAELFPLMPASEFADLLESVRKHGLRFPIIVNDAGQLLDGRHRYKACKQAEVEVRTDVFRGDDAAIFQLIKDANYHRRHLTVPQRARIASTEAQIEHGGDRSKVDRSTLKQADSAEAHNVSRESVTHARQIEDTGTDALKVAVFDRGAISLRDGAKIAHEPPDVQEELAAAENPKAKWKSIKRAQKERDLAERIEGRFSDLGEGRYGVVYADPPRRFEPWSRKTGMDRAADNHYPTMTVPGLLEMRPEIDQVAARDCVLYLWSTAPMLPEALKVMAAWGFAYKSRLVWIKDKAGTGYWSRDKVEILMIGTRGALPGPAEIGESAIEAPRGRHSEKPPIFRDIICGHFPELRKIELFAREAAEGWDVWGNEAPAGRSECPEAGPATNAEDPLKDSQPISAASERVQSP